MASLHLVDARGCSSPRLRALAACAAVDGARCAVIGTGEDARRAAGCGVPVAAAFAPPAGSIALGARAMRGSFGPLVGRTGAVVPWGARAVDAARACGWRSDEPSGAPPAPVPPDGDRASLRAAWELDERIPVFLVLASPAAACDSRAALDVVGRVAVLVGTCAMVLHPDCARLARTMAWTSLGVAQVRVVLDPRADDPERIAAAADVAIAIDRPHVQRGARGSGWARWAPDLARGVIREPAVGDALGARLAARAGLAVAVAATSGASAGVGAAVEECSFGADCPTEGARIAHRLLVDAAWRAEVNGRQRAAAVA